MRVKEKVIIFDFDGTIVNSSKAIMNAFNAIAEKYGLKKLGSLEDFKELYEGNVYEGIISRGLNKERLNEFFDDWRLPLLDENAEIKLINGMKEVIAILEKNNKLCVITSNSDAYVEKLLEKFGILGIGVVLGGNVNHSKVAKIKMIIKKYGKREYYYVGDTAGDMIEAKKAGIRAIGVSWGVHSHEMLEKSGADFVADGPEELLGILGSKNFKCD
ncbi:MAG: HAD family hydrolase [Nanoarchaeota archaeon]